MGYKFNPFTGNLDTVDSPNGVFEEIDVNGDITLDDGGTFTTTLQTVTPTANRTISFPDATGTIALVAGSSGQLLYNNAGANAGTSTITYDGTNVTLSGRFISSLNGAASAPPGTFTGTWFTGGTSTTTKPQVVIEPTGTTSTSWSTSGTGLGVNAASGFVGRLLDLQTNGTSRAVVTGAGNVGIGTTSPSTPLHIQASSASIFLQNTSEPSNYGVAITQSYATSNSFTIDWNNTSSRRLFAYNSAGADAGNISLNAIASDGSAGAFRVLTAGTERLRCDSIGSVRVVTALTVATLPGTPAVGMIARVTDATAPVVGMTVAGGGAAAALCWYNGANWSVIGV